MEEQFSLFMKFYYPEIKDLTLKFLTLDSSIFTFSVVFAEKVVDLSSPFSKRHLTIILSWILFLLSIIFGGIGLWRLFAAAEIANGSLVVQYNIEFLPLLRSIYNVLDVAGFLFVGALIMLAVSAITKFWTAKV